MVNIWKIGAWPGLWGRNTLKNKEKFIVDYALPQGFVALGYGYIPNIKKIPEEEIKEKLKNENLGKIGRRTGEILNFANDIEKDDIILLYNHFKVYIGIVKFENPYYYVEKGSKKDFIKDTIYYDIAPHRIDVEWQFNKTPFKVDFRKWQDTVHQILDEHLSQIKNKELRHFLKKQLHKPKTSTSEIIKRKYGVGGEGEDHKNLKEWVAKHPQEIGLTNVRKTDIEYHFPSGDIADIVYELDGNKFAVVEIETVDPFPGCYQSLKYKVLKCAELGLDIKSTNVEAIIVAWSIPQNAKDFCNKYEIRFVEKKL